MAWARLNNASAGLTENPHSHVCAPAMQLKKNIFSFLPDLFSPSSPSQLCRQDLPLAFTASILCLCSFATDHKSWFWLRRLTEVSPTEAEIAFAVAPRLDLVDTGPSTGGQDQPRPLFLCHHHHHHYHYYHCSHHHHHHHHHYML